MRGNTTHHTTSPGRDSTSSEESSPDRPQADTISLCVAPFIGRPFQVRVSQFASVDDVKRTICKRLRVIKDRICLLYRERQLVDGNLHDNAVGEGSRIVLLPRTETGLIGQKSDQSVMQALEGLSDEQVIDFLSGKAPLNLTMRLGDHMMLIQLQLSSLGQQGGRSETISSDFATPSSPQSESSPDSRQPRRATSLAEASRRLTHTLRQLSAEVMRDPQFGCDLTTKTQSKVESTKSSIGIRNQQLIQQQQLTSCHPGESEPTSSKSDSSQKDGGKFSTGAIIDSMHHHGKGVYSGTFSGTLNPMLQENNGHPKRDITTIIHILNDLLCAQYQSNAKKKATQSSTCHGSMAESSSTPNAKASLSFQTAAEVPPSRSQSKRIFRLSTVRAHCQHAPTVGGTTTVMPKTERKRRHSQSDVSDLAKIDDSVESSSPKVCRQDVTRSKVEILKKSMLEARIRRDNRRRQEASFSLSRTLQGELSDNPDLVTNVSVSTEPISPTKAAQNDCTSVDNSNNTLGPIKSFEVVVESKLTKEGLEHASGDADVANLHSSEADSLAGEADTSSTSGQQSNSSSGDIELPIQA